MKKIGFVMVALLTSLLVLNPTVNTQARNDGKEESGQWIKGQGYYYATNEVSNPNGYLNCFEGDTLENRNHRHHDNRYNETKEYDAMGDQVGRYGENHNYNRDDRHSSFKGSECH
ncbi:MAG: hypothetical protein ACK5LZ_03160 [Anaerorhabdus sp.]